MQSGGQNKRRFPCRTNARRVRVSAAPITIGKKDTNGQSNLIGPVFHSNTRPVFVTDQRDGNRSLTWQQQTGSTGQDLLFFFSFFFSNILWKKQKNYLRSYRRAKHHLLFLIQLPADWRWWTRFGHYAEPKGWLNIWNSFGHQRHWGRGKWSREGKKKTTETDGRKKGKTFCSLGGKSDRRNTSFCYIKTLCFFFLSPKSGELVVGERKVGSVPINGWPRGYKWGRQRQPKKKKKRPRSILPPDQTRVASSWSISLSLSPSPRISEGIIKW